ncbi:MAG TPA: hypothetical protein VK540_22250 [Polyangiaceae bacterium]|nr:hypothetical protein [Polyangiaceae bacterium]
MLRLLSSGILGIAILVGCGGRTFGPDADAGTGGANGTGGTTTASGGTTTGSGGTTVGGTGGSGTTGGSGGAGGTIDPELSSCTGPGQCELALKTCCSCETLRLDQLEPINAAKRDAFKKQVCGPAPLPCPPCLPTIDPHFMARCESGRCRGFDIRSDPTYTKCGTSSECVLRKGLACCVCNAPGDWVAVSRVGDMILTGETCAAASVCPGCVPVPPDGYSAVCRNGACQRIPP